ncbi:sorbin and SH3 domain-containing protein 1 homolog isoform X2 [Clytia hemisphaerica]|uniref:Uncharacterized protein n=1 Tax=Clytia hemisphaerica TaxID=252671 RepID=A0A7M5XFV3_9CNID
MAEFEVYLQGGSPWGFRLQGGKEFRLPLKISKVEPGGKAAIGGIRVGDHVAEINENSTDGMYHTEALTTVKRAQYSLSLVLKRPEESEDPTGHTIQSVSLAPEDNQTRVSLTIGTKSAPSSPRSNRRTYNRSFDSTDASTEPKRNANVPTGQAYMQKLVGSLNDLDDDVDDRMDDLPPQDRERSKTLPKSYGKNRDKNGDTSKSLPRNSSTSSEPPNKAPHWYKQMYKEMHTSMEGESHLSKLLSSDAKRGAFRKYDGATQSGANYRSMSPEERRTAFEDNSLSSSDAPRRLQGGGRAAATHHHRKSLPNIHASNFNFMQPSNYHTPTPSATPPSSSTTLKTTSSNPPSNGVTMRVNAKPSSTSTAATAENRKSINSDWYKALQKGGEIPEAGLATGIKTSKSASNISLGRSQTDGPPKKTGGISGHMQASQYHHEKSNSDTYVAPQPNTNIKYNAPVDFLELRKRELKNLELEKEREEIRQARERERLEEEERLRKQKENDRMIIAREQQNLEPVLTSPGPDTKQQRSPIQKTPPRKEPEPLLEPPKLPEFGRAKYSFHPQGPGELEFRKGDTVRIIQSIDENWIEGEYEGNIGIFPVSYVELIQEAPPSTPRQATATPSTPKENNTPPKQNTDRNNNKKSPPQHKEASPPTTNGYHDDRPVEEEPIIAQQREEIVESAPDLSEEQALAEPQQFNLEEGLGKARYTFRAETESELSFRKGDMITILKQVDDNWFEGELDGQIGIFPSNYIEVLKDPMVVELEPVSDMKSVSSSKQDVDFEQIFNDVLSEPTSPKSKQQVVAEEERMNHVNDTRNHNGYHHHHDDSYSEPEPREVEEEQPAGTELEDLVGKGEPHKAVYTYKPTNEDEVELNIGDIVHVLEKCDDGWFIGTSGRTGVFGTFPGNYVTPV